MIKLFELCFLMFFFGFWWGVCAFVLQPPVNFNTLTLHANLATSVWNFVFLPYPLYWNHFRDVYLSNIHNFYCSFYLLRWYFMSIDWFTFYVTGLLSTILTFGAIDIFHSVHLAILYYLFIYLYGRKNIVMWDRVKFVSLYQLFIIFTYM